MPSRFERRATWGLGLLGLWHTLALVVAPLPPSALQSKLDPAFAPYAQALFLDSKWRFFAPAPDPGTLVEYEVEDLAGDRHGVRPTAELAARGRLSQRHYHLWRAIRPDRPALNAGVARALCAEHAALRPARIRFTLVRQLPVPPELYLAGVRPLDAIAVERETLDWIACRRGS